MEGPDVGPEGPVDPWVRAARAPQPLPAPPAGYRFAAPDHLYAPPAPGAPEALAGLDGWPGASVAPGPMMVWSEATSTWEPAPARGRSATRRPVPPRRAAPTRRSRRLSRRRRYTASAVRVVIVGGVILIVMLLVFVSLGTAGGGFILYMPAAP